MLDVTSLGLVRVGEKKVWYFGAVLICSAFNFLLELLGPVNDILYMEPQTFITIVLAKNNCSNTIYTFKPNVLSFFIWQAFKPTLQFGDDYTLLND